MIKIAFLGNCQVDVYGKLLSTSINRLVEVKAIEIWRYTPDDFSLISDSLVDFDLVVSQPLSSFYGPLSTSSIRTSTNNFVLIHNIYFRGYHPDCVYIGPMGKRIKSPVGDYHSKIIYDCWQSNKSASEAASYIHNYPHDIIHNTYKESLSELIEREKNIDVPISEIIADYNVGWDMFFTFNHPKIKLLKIYLNRILDFIGLDIEFFDITDPLSKHTKWPIYNSVAEALRLPKESLHLKNFIAPLASGGHSYDILSFCQTCYTSYNKNSQQQS